MKSLTDPSQALSTGLAKIRTEFHVPDGFPVVVMAAAEAAAKRVPNQHTDRTAMPFVTLDPAASTDLDQAFSIEASRSDLARILAEESFDQDRLNALFARHDEALRTMRESLTSSLGKIHGALDPEQRKKLAEMLEYRFGFGHRGGPYRNAAVHI